MSHRMTLHEDVLERLLNILEQDDYYRTLEDLPAINGLTAYSDIRLFPELYDTTTIIKRIISEADIIETALTAGYVPLTYKPLTFHICFHTKIHLHIPTYCSSITKTSKNTRYTKSKYRIITPKFTTLWTMDTYKLKPHYKHHLKVHLHNHNHLPQCKHTIHHQHPI